MTQADHRADDSQFPKWVKDITPLEGNLAFVDLSAARVRATEEAGVAIARQLNGPVTALLLYMNEIKLHSHQFSQAPGNRVYLQQVIENALQQTETVCSLVKQISEGHPVPASHTGRPDEGPKNRGGARKSGAMFAAKGGQRPLTKREREVLNLISEGCSNKQGALRMKISPRTFESHRAEAMRKLGARNTADLVRKALQQIA